MNKSKQPPGEPLTDAAGVQLSDAAKPVVEQARQVAEEQQSAGAAKARTLAKAVHHAADDLEPQLPVAAGYIHSAAAKLDEASAALETRNLDELADRVREFAHNQPAAFFGAAALAGLALSRFLKSSAEGVQRAESFPKGA